MQPKTFDKKSLAKLIDNVVSNEQYQKIINKQKLGHCKKNSTNSKSRGSKKRNQRNDSSKCLKRKPSDFKLEIRTPRGINEM